MDNKNWKQFLNEGKKISGYKSLRESLLSEQYEIGDKLMEKIQKWGFKTINYTSNDIEIWSYSRILEVDEDRNSIEILGDGQRVCLIDKKRINDIRFNDRKSIVIYLTNGQLMISR